MHCLHTELRAWVLLLYIPTVCPVKPWRKKKLKETKLGFNSQKWKNFGKKKQTKNDTTEKERRNRHETAENERSKETSEKRKRGKETERADDKEKNWSGIWRCFWCSSTSSSSSFTLPLYIPSTPILSSLIITFSCPFIILISLPHPFPLSPSYDPLVIGISL